jgi:hypothetical protein
LLNKGPPNDRPKTSYSKTREGCVFWAPDSCQLLSPFVDSTAGGYGIRSSLCVKNPNDQRVNFWMYPQTLTQVRTHGLAHERVFVLIASYVRSPQTHAVIVYDVNTRACPTIRHARSFGESCLCGVLGVADRYFHRTKTRGTCEKAHRDGVAHRGYTRRIHGNIHRFDVFLVYVNFVPHWTCMAANDHHHLYLFVIVWFARHPRLACKVASAPLSFGG